MDENEYNNIIKRQKEKLEKFEKQINEYDASVPYRKEITERSIIYRGKIIDAVSGLDRCLDLYIATYFCDNMDKVKEFSNIILGANRISLDGKRKLFDILIKIQRPEFSRLYKSFNKNMNTVMYERNSFAHNSVCQNEEAIKKATTHIGLDKISANPRVEWYDEERIKSILKIVEKCSNIIIRMTRTRVLALRPADYGIEPDSPPS